MLILIDEAASMVEDVARRVPFPTVMITGAMGLRHSRYLLVLTLACASGVVQAIAQDQVSFDVIDLDTTLSLDRLAAQLASKHVVFVGETHDRYDHHLNQLEII